MASSSVLASSSRPIASMLRASTSSARRITAVTRPMSTCPPLYRPPHPTQSAASPEPAIVKSPMDAPNPANWPGSPKPPSSGAAVSQSASQSRREEARGDGGGGRVGRDAEQRTSMGSTSEAESSRSAQARADEASALSSTPQTQQTNSTSSNGEACSSLSPSSPSAPRSQQAPPSPMSSPKAIAPEQDTTKPEGSSATAKGAAAAAAAAVAAEAPPSPSPAPAPAGRNKAFRAKKEALSLTATAVERLRELLESESGPRLIRIGVRNKGCAGMSYHLEYVTPDQAGKFDERVKQDGVEVLIDSKALFSIIGSEMDWQEDRLSAKFVFNNPNVKESCGCGESFLT